MGDNQGTRISLETSINISNDKTKTMDNCDYGDIHVSYTIDKNSYSNIMNMINTDNADNPDEYSPFNQKTMIKNISKIIKDDGKNKILDICVPKKCKDGSRPFNIGKFISNSDNPMPLPESIPFYMCMTPHISSDNKQHNICRYGGSYINFDGVGMCVDFPRIYFKNFQ